MNVLSLNLGSSSLKYAVHAVADGVAECKFARQTSASPHPEDAAEKAGEAIADVLRQRIPIDAAGHRIVFGGEHDEPERITPALIARLEDLQTLDPLHAPGALAVIRQSMAALGDCVQVACFDTAFFRNLPESARTLPVPQPDPLLRRYGFHGLSYEHVCRALNGELKPRTIVAHLGNGASAAALLHGLPVATTMGFSPMSGMLMSSRPGDMDPGVLLYLLEHCGMDERQLRDMLENESGLRALSHGEGDLRKLCERTDEAAALAVEMFVSSASRVMAGLAVDLGGLDMLVFTGGIGAHNAKVRVRILERLSFFNSGLAVEIVEADENASIAHNAAAVANEKGSRVNSSLSR